MSVPFFAQEQAQEGAVWKAIIPQWNTGALDAAIRRDHAGIFAPNSIMDTAYKVIETPQESNDGKALTFRFGHILEMTPFDLVFDIPWDEPQYNGKSPIDVFTSLVEEIKVTVGGDIFDTYHVNAGIVALQESLGLATISADADENGRQQYAAMLSTIDGLALRLLPEHIEHIVGLCANGPLRVRLPIGQVLNVNPHVQTYCLWHQTRIELRFHDKCTVPVRMERFFTRRSVANDRARVPLLQYQDCVQPVSGQKVDRIPLQWNHVITGIWLSIPMDETRMPQHVKFYGGSIEWIEWDLTRVRHVRHKDQCAYYLPMINVAQYRQSKDAMHLHFLNASQIDVMNLDIYWSDTATATAQATEAKIVILANNLNFQNAYSGLASLAYG